MHMAPLRNPNYLAPLFLKKLKTVIRNACLQFPPHSLPWPLLRCWDINKGTPLRVHLM